MAPDQSDDPVADAATLRRRLLDSLRHSSSVPWGRSRIEAGPSFALAPSRPTGIPAEQMRHLAAEADRIATGPVFVVDPEVLDALGPVADDPTWQAPLSEDLLPAPAGMLCFPRPIDYGDATIATFTWVANHTNEPRRSLLLTGWAEPDRPTTDSTGTPAPGDAPLIPAVSLPLAYSPHLNGHLTAAMAASDPTVVCARSVAALWYALDAGRVRARGARVGNGPETVMLSLDADTPTEAVRDAIDLAWQRHLARGGHDGDDDLATVTAASGVFAAERDTESMEPLSRHLPQGYRQVAVAMARIESSATDRWPGLWSTLDRITAHRAPTSDDRTGDGETPSVADTATLLTDRFGADPAEARRYAPAVTGLSLWRTAGRHAVLLTGEEALGVADLGDAARTGAEGELGALPIPFLLMIAERQRTTMTLAFTSMESGGPRFWALNVVGTHDSLDCLHPEWSDLGTTRHGRGYDDGPGAADDLVVRFAHSVNLRVTMEPERVSEIGELLGRRAETIPWPTTPDPGCLTMWLAQPGIPK